MQEDTWESELLLRKMGHEPRLGTRTIAWGTREQDIWLCVLCGWESGVRLEEEDVEPCMYSGVVPEIALEDAA